MTSKEATRLANAQKSAAETEARSITRRWETEPEVIAYEMAKGKIDHLKGFLAGHEPVFNAYFVSEEATHELVHHYFKRELSQLSRELEYGSIMMPEEASEPFDILTTPNSILRCQYTTYQDGVICGVFYRALRVENPEVDTMPSSLSVPNSPVLGQTVGIESVPSL